MTAEIIGLVGQQPGSESQGFAEDPGIDPDWIRELAQAHEEAGFDRVLIGYSATRPDGFAIAQAVLNATTRLKVLIAHRPGFIAPTLEARKLITLDHLTSGGRVAIHHISGGSDTDQQRDGDYAPKADRYERTGEFIEVLRRTFTSTQPFSYSGRHYRVSQAYSAVRPATEAGIPIFIGGQSPEAVRIGARHADTFALFGEPLADTEARIGLIDAEAEKYGRRLDYSLSTRPVVADTEEEAWQLADAITADIDRNKGSRSIVGHRGDRTDDSSISSHRLQERAFEHEVHDQRLWFGATKHAGLGGNSSGHVGTPQQVADELVRYWDLGVRKFLIRGFDPLGDVRKWGTGLIPELRARIEARSGTEDAAA
jgi:alkanesulfonate monooxygenase